MAEIFNLPEDFDVTNRLREHLLGVVTELKNQLQKKTVAEEPQKYQMVVVLDKLTLALRRKILKRHELDEVLCYLTVLNEQRYDDSCHQSLSEASELILLTKSQ